MFNHTLLIAQLYHSTTIPHHSVHFCPVWYPVYLGPVWYPVYFGPGKLANLLFL